LREQTFDWVVDLQGLARSGLLAWLANGNLTCGLDEPREGARGFYDIVVQRPSCHTHAVDWYLRVLPALGVPVHRNFNWLPERPDVAAMIRQKWQPAAARWIVILPGARWLTKRWPAEHFAEVIKRLAEEDSELHFAVLGGADDREFGVALARTAQARCLDLTGQTSLSEMIEWMRLSHLVISNDTGPMHGAAALGKPLVAVFGPTNPLRTGPYGQGEHVLQARHLPCVPCLKRRCRYHEPLACLHAITPDQVCARARQFLK
jgi:lipopolysaccharide heptosyltransferase II